MSVDPKSTGAEVQNLQQTAPSEYEESEPRASSVSNGTSDCLKPTPLIIYIDHTTSMVGMYDG